MAALLQAAGATPAMLSEVGLVAMLIAGLALARNWIALAGALILVGGGLDGLDGEVARVSCTASEFGSFVDSICDHLGDFAIYLGLAWRALRMGLNSQIVSLLIICFGSLFASYLRARANLLEIDLKEVGIITRFERLVILLLGLMAHLIEPALWALAILINISSLQRLAFVLNEHPHWLDRFVARPRKTAASLEEHQPFPHAK